MRKKLLAMMLLAVLFIVGCSQKMEKDGIMVGKLVNELTGDPISGTVVIDGQEVKTDGEGNFKLETKVGNIAVKKISSKVEGYEDYSSEVIAKDGETIKIPLNPKYGETVVVNGLTVKLRKGIPARALSFVAEDYVNMVRKEAPKLIQNVDGEEEIILDDETIISAIETVTSSYPKPLEVESEDEEVSSKALDILLEDFPDLGDKLDGETDETKIAEAYETVSEVYIAQQTYAVNRQIINNEEKTVNKLKNNVYDETKGAWEEWKDLTPNEKKVALENIVYYKQIKDAKEKAFEVSDSWNSQGRDNTQKDALRHTLWQYLTCEYVTRESKVYNFGNYSKEKGFILAERLGTGRETVNTTNLDEFTWNDSKSRRYSFLDESKVMDIHNNAYARDFFWNNTSESNWRIVWVKKGRWFRYPKYVSPSFNHPSDEEATVYLKNAITNGAFIDMKDQKILEDFMNLGVKSKGVENYSGRVIYLKK